MVIITNSNKHYLGTSLAKQKKSTTEEECLIVSVSVASNVLDWLMATARMIHSFAKFFTANNEYFLAENNKVYSKIRLFIY
jgi:hypothetical protein